MLIDNPYYDYDYEYVKDKKYAYDKTVWSDDKVNSILKSASMKSNKRKDSGIVGNADSDLLRAEALQADAMRAIAEEKARMRK